MEAKRRTGSLYYRPDYKARKRWTNSARSMPLRRLDEPFHRSFSNLLGRRLIEDNRVGCATGCVGCLGECRRMGRFAGQPKHSRRGEREQTRQVAVLRAARQEAGIEIIREFAKAEAARGD